MLITIYTHKNGDPTASGYDHNNPCGDINRAIRLAKLCLVFGIHSEIIMLDELDTGTPVSISILNCSEIYQ